MMDVQDEPSTTTTNHLNPFDFNIEWEAVYMLKEGRGPEKIMARDVLMKNQRPSELMRDRIVYEIIDQVHERWPLAVRKSMETVYALMLQKHRSSFSDGFGASGTAYSGSWLYKLKNRLDNSRRKKPHDNSESKDRYERGPLQKSSYACTKWRVRDLPEEENEETQEEKKNILVQQYINIRPKQWNWAEILELMKITYKSQRDMINANIERAVEEAKNKRKRKRSDDQEVDDRAEDDAELPKILIKDIHVAWPFLFTYSGMLQHFQTLTGRDLEQDLQKFKIEMQSDMLTFFERLDKPGIDKILGKMTAAQQRNPLKDQVFKGLVLIASQYFEEEPVIQYEDKSSTLDELADKGPQYPGLTALGTNIFKAKKFLFGLDGQNYFSFVDFEKAFMTLFMSYYVFNIDYPPTAQITMEFFQRCVFLICPPLGHKRPKKSKGLKGSFSTAIIHPKVGKFYSKLEASRAKRKRWQALADSETEDN